MLDFPEPYLLAPSALTPTALRERAASLLASVAPDDVPPVGGATELRGHNFLYDAWLVRLGPDAASDLHAHENGYGAVAVVSGELHETKATPDGLYVRALCPGEMISTRPGDTHRLSVTGKEGAVALYLASPPRGSAPRIVTNATVTPVVPTALVG